MSNTAVIYARVSSKEQEREGYSIPAQVELFQQYAKTKNLNIVNEYLESESAKDSGRKLFNEMLTYVKQNKVKAIIFEKVDRMTRNYKDLITIYDLIETTDIQIHLIKNGLVLDRNSRSQDKFNLDINVVLARNYINNLSEEIKKGVRQKKLQGEWSHIAPFGYKFENKKVVLDENAKYVKEMFELASKGYSLQKISDNLSKKTNMKKSSIEYVLKNPFYMGYMRSKGELFRGNHETIVSPELFDIVQRKISNRFNKVDAVERVFRFSGVLKCGTCGSNMYGELKKGKYVTYGCIGNKYKKCDSTIKYFSETKLLKQLTPEIEKLTLTPEDMDIISGLIKEMFIQMEAESKQYGDITHKTIEKLKERMSNLIDYLDEGLLSKDEFLIKKKELQNKLIKAESEYSANITVPLETKENFKKLFEPAINLSKYWLKVEDVSLFMELMSNYYANLVIKEGKLSVTWTELGKLLYNRGERLEWWTELDSNQRTVTRADLQSAAFNHSAICPYFKKFSYYMKDVNNRQVYLM
jgi:site-specific DNA recombinase